jgi:hypothetical protein
MRTMTRKTLALGAITLATLLTASPAHAEPATPSTEPGWVQIAVQASDLADELGKLTQLIEHATPVDHSMALLICDSQCGGDSWVEQGARAAGFTTIEERMYGGGGYAAPAPALGVSVPDGLTAGLIELPTVTPGAIIITLGGNDATTGRSDTEILEGLRRAVTFLEGRYPAAKIIVNGVMSRADDAHARRRAVDELVMNEAEHQNLAHVSVAGWGTTYNAEYADGVHLTQTGSTTIGQPYAAQLKGVLG